MRRPLIALSLLAGWGVQPAAGGPPPHVSPHGKVEPVGLAEAKWTTGLWAERFEACRSGMLPALAEIMEGTKHSHFLENFRIAAGLAKGRHRGPPWNDGDLYKWVESMAAVYAVTKSPELDRKL